MGSRNQKFDPISTQKKYGKVEKLDSAILHDNPSPIRLHRHLPITPKMQILLGRRPQQMLRMR